MLGFKGPAQPSPGLGDALNAGYIYLEVGCLRSRSNTRAVPQMLWDSKLIWPIGPLQSSGPVFP
jgi:hypothetical protein